MSKLFAYQEIIEKQIKELKFPETPANLYDPLRYFLEMGGKRTRPALTMLGCNLFGEPGVKALNAAIAIELFHNFTLIHDDIMDDAPLRRGRVTVHEKWNSDIAILSGDTLFTIAIEMLCKNEPTILPRLLEIFTRTSVEVCEGQQMDMDFEEREVVSIDEYIEMIRLKTSVLIGAALEMGAVVAQEKNEENVQHLYDFGVNIGLAFQIQDDLLDVYADASLFGKQVGGDILANKKTFLLLKAFELADSSTKENLDFHLQNSEGETKVLAVKSIYEKLGIRAETENQKEIYFREAMTHLEAIDVPKENKEELYNLATELMSRER